MNIKSITEYKNVSEVSIIIPSKNFLESLKIC